MHNTRKQLKIVEKDTFLAKSTLEFGSYASSSYDESNLLVTDQAIPDVFYIYKPNNQFVKLLVNVDHPLSIPEGLLIHQNMYTKVDLETGMLYFFESHLKDHEHEIIGYMRLRTYFHEVLDFGKDSSDDRLYQNQAIAKFIMESPIDEVLSYNVINRKAFIFEAFKHKDLL
jgi:hypothetical protein